ncbi:growth hormone receptor b [Betta splendens]|uniref:Growth hormone receptor b n=1 Tax=Betta splendens TaxID=158456 RepID=A0A6P7P3U1_BETSP|nr:growth hormone receptor b [Betta splendens]
MAAALNMLLIALQILTALALESTSEQALPQRRPYLTGCVSTNMVTFRCTWNVGSYQNLSEPGALRLFYINKISPQLSYQNWSECPHYSTEQPNECFFNENHTTIWTSYSIQLRSGDQAVLYDENLFQVLDIVQPDPPIDLKWTLLNVSLTGTYCDIMLSWKPPQSADVETGWMTLQYEVQYRDINSDLWEVVDLEKSTQCSIYGLQTNVNYEVQVRCKMLGEKKFGEFSSSVFVHIPSKGSRFPVVALLIFGALCLVAILMLVIISQQEKLMVILLPPVPGPKIKGIDPELLKSGKLRELTSILGAPPDLRPELYNSDPWVEFIDLDIEEHNDRMSDPDCLMERSVSSNCSPLSIGFRDDDSGRASCCEPDLPCDLEASAFHSLIPVQTLSKDPTSTGATEKSPLVLGTTTAKPPVSALGREAMYTQVSEVRSSGKVLLSPENQTEVEKSKDIIPEKQKKNNEFEHAELTANDGGYTSEINAWKMSSRPCEGGVSESYHTASPSPCSETDITTVSPLPPPPVYTVVEGVDRQNSLLLTPNQTPAPQLIIPKTMPSPDGYLTPDLLGSVTP